MISVIIPAYNHERFIGAAIDSVLQQGWQDFELLIIDDGSTDNTAAVVKGYEDPRVAYFYQENQDAYNTLNRGLAMAKGDYISILNSDDMYAPDRLERLVTVQKHTGAACLFTDVIPMNDNGSALEDPDFLDGINGMQKNRHFYKKCGDLYTAFLKGNFMVTTSNLFMTAIAAKRVGKFCSLRYLHDYDYVFRMMLAYPDGVKYLDSERLLFYRIHEGNTLSEAAIIGREQDQKVISRYMLARIPDEYRSVVLAGSERLVELEQELNAVRQEMSMAHKPGIRYLFRQLVLALVNKVKRVLIEK